MRTWIHRLLLAAGAALMLALGGVAATGASGGTPGTSVTPGCSAGSLRAAYAIVTGSNGAGQVEYTLTIVNRSHRTCSLSAPPALTLRGAHGQALPTHASFTPPGPYPVVLGAGQFAQDVASFSPDVAGPGENGRRCEPVAHALDVAVGTGRVRAPMDPTMVCGHGRMLFRRLTAAKPTPACAPSALHATFNRQSQPFGGFADYSLTLRNRGATACHLNSIVGLRLLGASGGRLPTRVSAGVSAPMTIGPHVLLTAFAMLAHGGAGCDPAAPRIAITPAVRGRSLTAPVKPPATVCRGGLIELSSLFRNG